MYKLLPDFAAGYVSRSGGRLWIALALNQT